MSRTSLQKYHSNRPNPTCSLKFTRDIALLQFFSCSLLSRQTLRVCVLHVIYSRLRRMLPGNFTYRGKSKLLSERHLNAIRTLHKARVASHLQEEWGHVRFVNENMKGMLGRMLFFLWIVFSERTPLFSHMCCFGRWKSIKKRIKTSQRYNSHCIVLFFADHCFVFVAVGGTVKHIPSYPPFSFYIISS